jgi:hypothetical protein
MRLLMYETAMKQECAVAMQQAGESAAFDLATSDFPAAPYWPLERRPRLLQERRPIRLTATRLELFMRFERQAPA